MNQARATKRQRQILRAMWEDHAQRLNGTECEWYIAGHGCERARTMTRLLRLGFVEDVGGYGYRLRLTPRGYTEAERRA